MKRITRVISMVTGAIASLFTLGCHKEPECIYGPPSMLNQQAGQVKSSSDMDNGDVKPESDADLPESEGVPADIYGPPEMFDEPAEELPESEGVPADIYGPPEMFDEPVEEIPPEVVAEPEPVKSAAAQKQDEADEEAQKKAKQKDFETLKKVNSSRTKKEKKCVYGPPER